MTAVLYCLFAAGIVFGYAALKQVLISERVYREQCTKEELEDKVEVCAAQELRLNFIFTVAAVSTNVCALPVGIVLDRDGPRVASLTGCFFIALGCLFLAFAADLTFDGYIPGYLSLALGGPFVFIPSFHLSNTFPRYSGLILALLTGAFDTSSAQFLFYRLGYFASGHTLTPKKYFLVYLIIPVLILLAQITLMPSKTYQTVGELIENAEDGEETSATGNHSTYGTSSSSQNSGTQSAAPERRSSTGSEVTALLGSKDAADHLRREDATKAKSGVWGALHSLPASRQIITPWFILIAVFTILQMTRINYFVATVRPQYEYLLHSVSLAREINHFFDIALPLGGVISVPFVGLILDNTSTPFVIALLVIIATAIGILGVIPGQVWAAYANIILFVLYRPFYYTAVSDYAAKVFGFQTFGKAYGLIICLAGLGNFSQSALDAARVKWSDGDPIPVNVLLLGLGAVLGAALWAYVWWKSKSLRRDMLAAEAEGTMGSERERLMPGADVPPNSSDDEIRGS